MARALLIGACSLLIWTLAVCSVTLGLVAVVIRVVEWSVHSVGLLCVSALELITAHANGIYNFMKDK